MRISEFRKAGRIWKARVSDSPEFSFDPYNLSALCFLPKGVTEIYPATEAVVYKTDSGDWGGYLFLREGNRTRAVDVSDLVSKAVEGVTNIMKNRGVRDTNPKAVYLALGKPTSGAPATTDAHVHFTVLTGTHTAIYHPVGKMHHSGDASEVSELSIGYALDALNRFVTDMNAGVIGVRTVDFTEVEGPHNEIKIPFEEFELLITGNNNAKLIATPAEDSLIPVYTYHTVGEHNEHLFIHTVADPLWKIPTGVDALLKSYPSHLVSGYKIGRGEGEFLTASTIGAKHTTDEAKELAKEISHILKSGDTSRIRVLKGENTVSYLFTNNLLQLVEHPVTGAYLTVQAGDQWYLLMPQRNPSDEVGLIPLPVHPDDIKHYRNYFSEDQMVSPEFDEDNHLDSVSVVHIPTNTVFIIDEQGAVYAAGRHPALIGEEEYAPLDAWISEGTTRDYTSRSIGSDDYTDNKGIKTEFRKLSLEKPVKKIVLSEQDDLNFPQRNALYFTEDGEVYIAGKASSSHMLHDATYTLKCYKLNKIEFEGVDKVDDIYTMYGPGHSLELGTTEGMHSDDKAFTFVIRTGDKLLGFEILSAEDEEMGDHSVAITDENFEELLVKEGTALKVNPVDIVPSFSSWDGKKLIARFPTHMSTKLCK